MFTTFHYLFYQLWLHLGTALPAILSQVAPTIEQFLQALFISWVMQEWSERRKGNLSGNHHQVEGGARPQSAPISPKNAITRCQSPDRATSNSRPRASFASIVDH